MQPRRPLTHVIEYLTPSTVEKYLTCPRRFFYGQVLRLAPELDDEVTLLGNLIHRVLAKFHERERDFTSTDDLDARRTGWQSALLELIDSFAPAAAQRAGVPFDSNFMRYELTLARSYMARYVELLADETAARPFTVLACEFEVDSEIAKVRFRGRADRIDRLISGGLAIRDYKSGASKPRTAPAVRTALQRLDNGEVLAGDVPDGLNLQTLLYIPLVEAAFGEPVVQVEYLYFRGKRHEGKSIVKDAIEIAEGGVSRDAGMLTRDEVVRVQTDLAAPVARALADGSVSAFSTALDVQTCRYCDFVHACPGALMVAP